MSVDDKKVIYSMIGVSKYYDKKPVLKNIYLSYFYGAKIGVLGLNGSGKSSLLKILAGVLDYDKGQRKTGHNVQPGYFPQHRTDLLNPENSCFEDIYETSINKIEPEVRKLMGRFLFVIDDVFKKISVLSGGEKSRLVFIQVDGSTSCRPGFF